MQEAEILMTANEEIRALAEKGDLKNLHRNYDKLKSKVEVDYLTVREHIQKLLLQVEAKENDIYAKLNELGLEKIKKQGDSSLMDVLGLAHGDPIFNNLAIVDAAIQNNHEASE